jgi:TPR repeat protein
MRSLMIKATQSPNRRCRNFDDRRAPDARRRVWRLGVALLLAGLWSAPLASANEFNDGERAYARADYTRAAAIFSREAERGQAAAQTYLGYMYAQGRGVPQDEAKAAQWLRRAADQGYPAAQFLLGKMVDKGQGVKQDFVEAEVLLDLAVARAEPKERDYWTRIRNAVASKLTRAELAEAQKRALEWLPIRER